MTENRERLINTSGNTVVLFDGVCNLCNSSVDFLIKRDSKRKFRYASLQSDTAQQLLKDANYQGELLGSIVVVADGTIREKSNAVLFLASQLGGIYRLLSIFSIVPKKIRDWIYDRVASNRYRWFGKRDTCRLPTKEEKRLFLA